MRIDTNISGNLTPEERKIINAHSLNSAKVLSVFPYFHDIIPVVRHHHEWYDGTGYPDRLIGENIPFMSRIIMIADAFVAMTSDRPYRDALTTDEALSEIEKNKGIQFDPNLINFFTIVFLEDPGYSPL